MPKPLSEFSNGDLAVLYYFTENELSLCSEYPDAHLTDSACLSPEQLRSDLLSYRNEFSRRGLVPPLH